MLSLARIERRDGSLNLRRETLYRFDVAGDCFLKLGNLPGNQLG